jgi:hypothetical protein
MIAPQSNRPVPAAIDGRAWSVDGAPADLFGATDTKRARLICPIGDSATARMVRNHELAHARITPRVDAAALCKRHSVTMEALQWSEDSRISTFLHERELVDADALTDGEADGTAKVLARSDRAVAGAFLVHWDLPNQFMRLRDAFIRAGVLADDLDGILERLQVIRETAARGASGGRRGRRRPWSKVFAAVDGFKVFTIPLALAFDREFPADAPRRSESERVTDRRVRAVKGRGLWGTLTDVFKPRLSATVRPRRSPGRRFSDCGVLPSAVHRLPVDGAVFTAKRPKKGGTVLCDASGSMDYGDDDIARIIREAPGSTVAFYAGAEGHSRAHGRIVVGAAGGRAATVADIMKALPGRQNKIDGPALRWLARQPAPRFWISDQEVGGAGGDFGVGGVCHDECLRICRAADIRILPNIGALKR